MDKTLDKLTKKRKVKTQINKIRDEKEIITIATNDIQPIILEYFKSL
jgi:hypothetical protein